MSYTSFTFNDYLSATFASTYDTPLTIVAWVRREASAWAETGLDILVMMGDDLTDVDNSIGLGTTNGAADSVCITAATTPAGQDISSNATFSDGTYDGVWVPIIGVWTNAAQRNVYVGDSSTTASDTTSIDEGSALDNIIVGRSLNGGLLFNGYVAEVAVFTSAWSTTLVNQVRTASGTGPAPNTIDPTNCIGYWPLAVDQATHSDESGNSGPNMTTAGSVAYSSAHPTIISSIPVFMHHRRMLGMS